MKKLIALCCFLMPLVCFCQGYVISFSDLKTGSVTVTNLDNVEIKNENIDDAIVTITGVSSTEMPNIKLAHHGDASKIITPEALTGDGKLVFRLKDHIGPAKNKFQLLYKDVQNAVIQFDDKRTGKVPPADDESDLTTYIAAIANANFVGNNKFLSNLTPIVTLGGIVDLSSKSYGTAATSGGEKPGKFTWRLDLNPYLGAQIDTKDSMSFIPALMLGGRAGFIMNNYLSWSKNGVEFTWMPLGIGLKLIPGIKDSTINIWQHNLRTGVSLKFKEVFILGAQYTHGFHNTTSESKLFYKKVFSKSSTDISYLTVTGQFAVKAADETRNNYLYIEWRGLLSKKEYDPFTNVAIVTVGFRKDLALTNTFPTATPTSTPGSTKRLKKRLAIF